MAPHRKISVALDAGLVAALSALAGPSGPAEEMVRVAMMVDAHVVAAAVESGGGVCLTSDPDDLGRLGALYSHVTIVDITRQ